MKIQIRKGLFETNSSSAHTLVYSKNEHVDIEKYVGHYLKADIKSYGRYYEILDKPEEKLSYILTILNSSDGLYERYFPIIHTTLTTALVNYSTNDNSQLKNELAEGIFNPNHILSHAKWYCDEVLNKPYDEDLAWKIYEEKRKAFDKKYTNANEAQKRRHRAHWITLEEHLINNFKGTCSQRQALKDCLKRIDAPERYEWIQVDHQSLYNYIDRDGKKLIPKLEELICSYQGFLDFLFSDKSFIIIDYDENDYWWKDFKEAFESHGVNYPKDISSEIVNLSAEEEAWRNTYGWDKPFPKDEELRKLEINGYYFPDGVHVIE